MKEPESPPEVIDLSHCAWHESKKEECCDTPAGIVSPVVLIRHRTSGENIQFTVTSSHECGIASWTFEIRVTRTNHAGETERWTLNADFTVNNPQDQQSVSQPVGFGTWPTFTNWPVPFGEINDIVVKVYATSTCGTVGAQRWHMAWF